MDMSVQRGVVSQVGGQRAALRVASMIAFTFPRRASERRKRAAAVSVQPLVASTLVLLRLRVRARLSGSHRRHRRPRLSQGRGEPLHPHVGRLVLCVPTIFV